MKHSIHSFYKSGAEWVMPVRKHSAYFEKGVMTPEEFVISADHLVRTCPTWRWERSDPKYVVCYLPKDKQYLITRNVPCHERETFVEGEVDLITGDSRESDGYQVLRTNQSPEPSAKFTTRADYDIPDLEDVDWSDTDDQTIDHLKKTKTYDLMITYDKYYQVPRCWLFGYDENRRIMSPRQIMEDMSRDHAHKTITIDPFPFSGIPCASVHPCRHAEVLHKMTSLSKTTGKTVRVEDAMIVFLKFMSSIMPTIQYDFTLSAGF